MGCSDSLPSVPPRFVSFAWRYHPCTPVSLPSTPRATPRAGAFRLSAPVPRPALRVETRGPPRFLGNPTWTCPALRPRWDRPRQADYGAADAAFRSDDGVGSHDDNLFRGSITRPAHSLSTPRNAGRPAPRKTRFRLPASFAGWDWLPTGFQRKVSATWHPPFPGFAWRTIRDIRAMRSEGLTLRRIAESLGVCPRNRSRPGFR